MNKVHDGLCSEGIIISTDIFPKISKHFISIISVVYAPVCTHGSIKCSDLPEDTSKLYPPSRTDSQAAKLKLKITMPALKQWLTSPWKGPH